MDSSDKLFFHPASVAANASLSDDCTTLLRFPERLMNVLEDEGANGAFIWWFDDGKAFGIKPKLFTELILLKNFDGTKNFHNFRRKLNRWGFKRAESRDVPNDTVTYCHRFFVRGQPELIKKMSGASKKPWRDAASRPAAGARLAKEQHPPVGTALQNAPVAAARFDLPSVDSATVSIRSSSPLPSSQVGGRASPSAVAAGGGLRTWFSLSGAVLPSPASSGACILPSARVTISETSHAVRSALGEQQALRLLLLQRRVHAAQAQLDAARLAAQPIMFSSISSPPSQTSSAMGALPLSVPSMHRAPSPLLLQQGQLLQPAMSQGPGGLESMRSQLLVANSLLRRCS